MKKIMKKSLIMSVIACFMYFVIIPFYVGDITMISIPLGSILGIISIVYLIMEARSDLPIFYGKSQQGGSNANASIIMGIAISILSTSMLFLAFYVLIGIAMIYLIAMYVKKKTI